MINLDTILFGLDDAFLRCIKVYDVGVSNCFYASRLMCQLGWWFGKMIVSCPELCLSGLY